MSVITGLYAFGESIETILIDWELMGVFEYVLPFLLVFAVVFGILTKSKILGENTGVNVVISIVVGGISITSLTFRSFFRVIIPYAGVGVVILLVGIILVGLFCKSNENWWRYGFYGIGAIIFFVVVFSTLTSYEVSFLGNWWWQQYMSSMVVGAIIVALILMVILVTKSEGGGGGKT